MAGRAAKTLLGPHPLRTRWRIATGAMVLSLALFGLAALVDTGPGLRLLPALGMAALFIALYMLVLRILHPALVRRVNRGRTFSNRLLRWYLSTGD